MSDAQGKAGDRVGDYAFGRSLHADFYEVAEELCGDLAFCYRLLEDLVAWLGMHKQSPPFLFHSPEAQFPDKAGLSGWVPLIESGISIHTLTKKRFVTIDIYTCGSLSVDEAMAFLVERLKAKSCESHFLIRGVRYHA